MIPGPNNKAIAVTVCSLRPMTRSAGSPTMPLGVRQAWGCGARASKPGPKSAFSITEIAEVATELADAEGVAALSLGRIAERLGVTPNALYRYVDSREDLDAIVHDHALGAPGAIEPGDDWAEAAAAWCRALHERYRRHPWLAELRVRIPFSPNALAWLDDLLGRLAASGLCEPDALHAAILLDGYVRSRAAASRQLARASTRALDGSALVELVGAARLAQALPRVSALIATGLYWEPPEGNDADFEFGLESILAGLKLKAGGTKNASARRAQTVEGVRPEPRHLER